MNTGQRQTIVAWWIFHQQQWESTANPDKLLEWIEQAESNLDRANERLADAYDEYVPQ